MPLNVTIAQHDPMWLKVTGDIARGWRRNERGYGFFAAGSIPYPGDRSIEVTMNVRVRPHHRPNYFPEFPTDIQMEDYLLLSGTKVGWYSIMKGKSGLLIAAGYLRESLEQFPDEYVRFEEAFLTPRRGPAHIRMNVSMRVHSAPPEDDAQRARARGG